jgi:diaminopimelate decarboxylase
MLNEKWIPHFEQQKTPFYFYDMALFEHTLEALKQAAPKRFHIHYALKANANHKLLEKVKAFGFGADCVSGNEIKRALELGFASESIVFAGVGKSDDEIELGLNETIFCFNVESSHELLVINQLAKKANKVAPVAFRINPNVDAYTHKYITTGLEENKFGINPYEFDDLLSLLKTLSHVKLIGLHFHIGSQITSLTPYKNLCTRVNEINQYFIYKGYTVSHINLGGGLGINYKSPDEEAIVDFKSYFEVFEKFLDILPQQKVHFELGRSIVAQCGSLISRVLYIKNGINTNFAILDAGMTELIRPALYQAFHTIEALNFKNETTRKYDVVGPICESSDCFGKAVVLPELKRGSLIAIRSAGAYGEVMSSRYNLRDETKALYSDDLA